MAFAQKRRSMLASDMLELLGISVEDLFDGHGASSNSQTVNNTGGS